jgi:hypothetical protein
MRFQPGQSGNPAGRPLGSRNKETVAREEELAARAEQAVERIISLARGGNAVAMRICAEWVRPGGNSRALALELPPVTCSEDATVALQTVLGAFGRGEITVRELPPMLAAVDRAVRIADRIAQMRDRERVGRQIRGELHPSLLPRQVGPPDPLDAAIARGEDPFADDEEAPASRVGDEGLYSPVNFDEETSVAAGEPSPVAAEPCAADDEGLYFPVNSDGEAAGAAGEPSPVAAEPRAADDDGLYFPVNSDDATARGASEASSEAARCVAPPS